MRERERHQAEEYQGNEACLIGTLNASLAEIRQREEVWAIHSVKVQLHAVNVLAVSGHFS